MPPMPSMIVVAGAVEDDVVLVVPSQQRIVKAGTDDVAEAAARQCVGEGRLSVGTRLDGMAFVEVDGDAGQRAEIGNRIDAAVAVDLVADRVGEAGVDQVVPGGAGDHVVEVGSVSVGEAGVVIGVVGALAVGFGRRLIDQIDGDRGNRAPVGNGVAAAIADDGVVAEAGVDRVVEVVAGDHVVMGRSDDTLEYWRGCRNAMMLLT